MFNTDTGAMGEKSVKKDRMDGFIDGIKTSGFVLNKELADVGINYDENGKQHGDCAAAVYEMEDIKVTPRIGGVGLMTRAMLLYNVCVAKYGEHKMEEMIK